MEEKEVLSGALAKAELGRVAARAALADLVAAAEPVIKEVGDAVEQCSADTDTRFRNPAIENLDAAVERARKVMKEEA